MLYGSIKKLFFFLLLISIIILVVISIWLFSYLRLSTEHELDHNAQIKAFYTRYLIMEYYDKASYQFDQTETRQRSKMDTAIEYFAKNGIDASLEPLKKQLDDEESVYDVYLINRDLVVQKTTFQNDIGLDFKSYPDAKQLFEKQFVTPTLFDLSKVFYNTSRGDFTRYSTRRSLDGRFIIQLGESKHSSESWLSFITSLQMKMPTLEEYSIFSVFKTSDEPKPIIEIWAKHFLGQKKNDTKEQWDATDKFKLHFTHVNPKLKVNFSGDDNKSYEYLNQIFKNKRYIDYSFEKNGRYYHTLILPMKTYYQFAERSIVFLVMTFDDSEVHNRTTNIQLLLFGIWIVLILILMVLVYLFFNKIIRPIGYLEEKMKNKESIEDTFFLSQNDEILSIGHTYNKLLGDIEDEIKTKMDLLNQFKTFTANVIHQVRTPLSIIKIAQESMPSNDAKLNVQASIITMEHLYDTLAYSLSKNDIELPCKSIRLSDILLQRVSMFTALVHANDMTIKTSIEVECQINMNPMELEFLIDNNLSNSIKYGKPNHNIYVKVQKNIKDPFVKMSFYSFGNQIFDTALIFERFERIDKSKKGNGLGLNIVAEICHRYGIEIHVDYVDNQNVFRYLIPC